MDTEGQFANLSRGKPKHLIKAIPDCTNRGDGDGNYTD
jgi:hypothetical protein